MVISESEAAWLELEFIGKQISQNMAHILCSSEAQDVSMAMLQATSQAKTQMHLVDAITYIGREHDLLSSWLDVLIRLELNQCKDREPFKAGNNSLKLLSELVRLELYKQLKTAFGPVLRSCIADLHTPETTSELSTGVHANPDSELADRSVQLASKLMAALRAVAALPNAGFLRNFVRQVRAVSQQVTIDSSGAASAEPISDGFERWHEIFASAMVHRVLAPAIATPESWSIMEASEASKYRKLLTSTAKLFKACSFVPMKSQDHKETNAAPNGSENLNDTNSGNSIHLHASRSVMSEEDLLATLSPTTHSILSNSGSGLAALSNSPSTGRRTSLAVTAALSSGIHEQDVLSLRLQLLEFARYLHDECASSESRLTVAPAGMSAQLRAQCLTLLSSLWSVSASGIATNDILTSYTQGSSSRQRLASVSAFSKACDHWNCILGGYIAETMLQQKVVRQRREGMRMFKSCAQGSDLVSWLWEQGFGSDRKESALVLQLMHRGGCIRHIHHEHCPGDDAQLYKVEKTNAQESAKLLGYVRPTGSLYTGWVFVRKDVRKRGGKAGDEEHSIWKLRLAVVRLESDGRGHLQLFKDIGDGEAYVSFELDDIVARRGYGLGRPATIEVSGGLTSNLVLSPLGGAAETSVLLRVLNDVSFLSSAVVTPLPWNLETAQSSLYTFRTPLSMPTVKFSASPAFILIGKNKYLITEIANVGPNLHTTNAATIALRNGQKEKAVFVCSAERLRFEGFLCNQLQVHNHHIDLEQSLLKPGQISVGIITWNMGANPPDKWFDQLASQLKISRSPDGGPTGILVFGVQECTFDVKGAQQQPNVQGSVSTSAATANSGKKSTESIWRAAVCDACGPEYICLRVVSLWQVKLCILVHKSLAHHVTDVESDVVATGFAGVVRNKGGAAVALTIARTKFLFVCSHLAARPERVPQRKKNVRDILRLLKLHRDGLPIETTCDHIIWLGDLNFRLTGIPFEQVLDYVQKGDTADLKQYDQLLIQQQDGQLFSAYAEPSIQFNPTYRMVPGGEVGQYGNKRGQCPSWCDRVLVRSNIEGSQALEYTSVPSITISDHTAVRSQWLLPLQGKPNLGSQKPASTNGGEQSREEETTFAISVRSMTVRIARGPKFVGLLGVISTEGSKGYQQAKAARLSSTLTSPLPPDALQQPAAGKQARTHQAPNGTRDDQTHEEREASIQEDECGTGSGSDDSDMEGDAIVDGVDEEIFDEAEDSGDSEPDANEAGKKESEERGSKPNAGEYTTSLPDTGASPAATQDGTKKASTSATILTGCSLGQLAQVNATAPPASGGSAISKQQLFSTMAEWDNGLFGTCTVHGLTKDDLGRSCLTLHLYRTDKAPNTWTLPSSVVAYACIPLQSLVDSKTTGGRVTINCKLEALSVFVGTVEVTLQLQDVEQCALWAADIVAGVQSIKSPSSGRLSRKESSVQMLRKMSSFNKPQG